MCTTHHPSFRRSLAALIAITLPFATLGCSDNSEALLPLAAACDGIGVPEAADYDANATGKIAVAIEKDGDLLAVRNEFLGEGPKVAGDVATAQVVVCVYPDQPTETETCNYVGAQAVTIKRQEKTANVKLVVAKTGQVLEENSMYAQALPCPESIKSGTSTSRLQIYDAESQLTAAIARWVPKGLANAQSPKSQEVKEK
ncbi:MAG: hypothetical protein ACFCA4_01885 [Cyanophyceae cyanobacterium]